MKFRIEPATAEVLAARAAWRYPPPYDFYDDDGNYGLGLRPDLTGRGLGLEFVQAGIAFAQERFGRKRLVLDVAEFNERAIHVYEGAGFRRTGSHLRSDVRFIDMERPA